MFCYQCEQTAQVEKDVRRSVFAGNSPMWRHYRICLFTPSEGLAQVAMGEEPESRGHCRIPGQAPFVCKALFSTLTNVNFDPRG